MKKLLFAGLIGCLLPGLVLAQTIARPESQAVAGQWKVSLTDNPDYARPDYNDAAWSALAIPSRLELPAGGGTFWLRIRTRIPAELADQLVWFDTGKTGAAFDLYLDGQYIGSRGRLPPDYRLRQQHNEVILIPPHLIRGGEQVLALRCHFSSVSSELAGFNFINQAQADWLSGIQVFFNMRMYVILAAICLFLGIFFVVQFVGNRKDVASLYYALSLILIAIYFFDMGSSAIIADLLQVAIARAAMNASLGFLLLFFMHFFERPAYRIMRIVVLAVCSALTVAYLAAHRNNVSIDLIFNISLLPVFAVIIYALITVIRSAIRKNIDAWPILIGLVIGIGFGIHDIVYQVSSRQPFAWLQGITFFLLNLSVFVAMSMRSARAQAQNQRYTLETSRQHERLGRIVGSVQRLVEESGTVTKTLDSAVKDISTGVAVSNRSAGTIASMLQEQRQGLDQADTAIGQLLESIANVNRELQGEAVSIEASARDTARLIEGFSAISAMLRETASFTDSLEQLTGRGQEHMSRLSKTMDSVHELSSQIRSVVDAVNDFAERTNLLAMNASIEAAHAGSSGRGFAVIAQEIKKLAAASSDRASRINELVLAIEEAVQHTVETGDIVGKSLKEIAAGADEAANRIHDASSHTEQQQKAGAAIAGEAAKLAESAQRMIREVDRQAVLSRAVGEGMHSLRDSVARTEETAREIMVKNRELEEQASRVREATSRTQTVAGELQKQVQS